jgi:methionyl-tRNA synthetase
MPDKTFYITTPIYYVNDVPHVGNASTTIASDVIARFKRLQGHKVLFVTGTDENAPKVAEAAAAKGMDPQSFVDDIVPRFKEVWRKLHITNDVFIRTTEHRHKAVVEATFMKLLETGDIYRDVYKGWYCISDETFFRETEVADGLCPNPECRKKVRWVEEENYFFRLSAYSDRLLEWIGANPDALGPEFRKNEVVSFIKAGLRDACISRASYGWGIPVPGDKDKVIYVWFDALVNYLTVAEYLKHNKDFEAIWPPDVQLMAKEIFVRFHATLWPAMLMGLGLPLPKKIFAHGFWTIEGEKISKSKGNAISPIKLAEDIAELSGADVDIAVDAIRYFILREVTFGLDGNFSVGGLIGRFNSDLANDLGNLLNRTLPLLHKNRQGIVPEPGELDEEAQGIRNLLEATVEEVAGYLDRFQFGEALASIWTVVGRANKFVENQAPWKLAKDDGCAARLDMVLYTALETLRSIAILINPMMPSASNAIWAQLGISEPISSQRWESAGVWAGLKPGTQTTEPRPIFPRIDTKALAEKITNISPSGQGHGTLPKTTAPVVEGHSALPKPGTAQEEAKKVEQPIEEQKSQYITYEEFKKVELRVGKILTAERIPKADKLLKLTVDIGTEQRQIVAGIAQWYSTDELVGRLVVVVANLAPATLRGVESQGMLLAADLDGAAVLLLPDKEVAPGSTVR